MDLMKKVLCGLLPPGGVAWRLPPVFRSVIDALGASLERLKDFLDQAIDESLPSSADDTLPEWFEMLGLEYDATAALADRQATAHAAFTAFGGQDVDYLNGVIQIAYPNVTVERILDFYVPENMAGYGQAGRMQAQSYPSWMTPTPTDGRSTSGYYRLNGTVGAASDLNGLQQLLDRIMPAEMEPVNDVTVA